MRQSVAMADDDRFDDLIESLGGFHRTWLVYLGLELGLFAAIRAAGQAGITPADLAGYDGSPRPGSRDLGLGRERPRPGRAG